MRDVMSIQIHRRCVGALASRVDARFDNAQLRISKMERASVLDGIAIGTEMSLQFGVRNTNQTAVSPHTGNYFSDFGGFGGSFVSGAACGTLFDGGSGNFGPSVDLSGRGSSPAFMVNVPPD
jgi:hypothetical protein